MDNGEDNLNVKVDNGTERIMNVKVDNGENSGIMENEEDNGMEGWKTRNEFRRITKKM